MRCRDDRRHSPPAPDTAGRARGGIERDAKIMVWASQRGHVVNALIGEDEMAHSEHADFGLRCRNECGDTWLV
jgi:hypothetical protein